MPRHHRQPRRRLEEGHGSLGPRFSPARLPRFSASATATRVGGHSLRLGSDSVLVPPRSASIRKTNRHRSKSKRPSENRLTLANLSLLFFQLPPLRQSGSNPPARTVPPRPAAMTASAPAAARARPSAWRPTAVTSVATTAAMIAVTTTVAGSCCPSISFSQRDPAKLTRDSCRLLSVPERSQLPPPRPSPAIAPTLRIKVALPSRTRVTTCTSRVSRSRWRSATSRPPSPSTVVYVVRPSQSSSIPGKPSKTPWSLTVPLVGLADPKVPGHA